MDATADGAWLSAHPEVLAAIVLAVGILLARVCARATGALLSFTSRLMARYGSDSGPLLPSTFERPARTLVFWAVLLISALLALRLLAIAELSVWLDAVLVFTSQALLAVAIVVAGHVIGLLVRGVLERWPSLVDGGIPRLAYAGVLIVATVTALEHLGLDITFLRQLALLVVALFAGGITLAFALGARTLAANLSAQAELARYQPGERIRVHDVDGVIVEIHRTGLVLRTADGQVNIPAAWFAQHPVLRMQAPE